MRYAVWGFGAVARHLVRFLKEDVSVIVDGSQNKIGSTYRGLDIVSPEMYSNRFSGCPILVTPVYGMDELLVTFNKYNISNYFMMSETSDLFCRFSKEELLGYLLRQVGEKTEVWLYGMHFLNVYFGVHLKRRGTKVNLIYAGEEGKDHRDFCKEYFPEFEYIRLNDVVHHEEILYTRDADGATLRKVGVKGRQIYHAKDLLSIHANPQLAALHNLYKGKRCFVVATGPSLTVDDLNTLHKHREICISMNSIFLAFPHTSWRPEIFAMSDGGASDFYGDQIDDMDVTYKLIADIRPEFWDTDHPNDVIMLPWLWSYEGNDFSDDISLGAYGVGTIVYTCLQIATYIGCQEIYLLGVDFTVDNEKSDIKQHFIEDNPQIAKEDQWDNFLRQKVYNQELFINRCLKGYVAAKTYALEHGIHIYNATRGGNLEVFERKSFDSLF